MGIFERLGLKKTEITKLNKGLLDLYQCRCVGGEDDCPTKFHMFKRDWCGVTPLINFKCPNRRPPQEVK